MKKSVAALLTICLVAFSLCACYKESPNNPHEGKYQTQNNKQRSESTAPSGQEISSIEDVSIIQLISNPNEFHGKTVRVIGYARLQFEGEALYLHSDDYKYAISKNGLWLSTTDEILKNREAFDRKYILVEGVFNAMHQGHAGLFSGSIEKIQRFQVWYNSAQR